MAPSGLYARLCHAFLVNDDFIANLVISLSAFGKVMDESPGFFDSQCMYVQYGAGMRHTCAAAAAATATV